MGTFGYEIIFEGNTIRAFDEMEIADSYEEAFEMAQNEIEWIVDNEEGYEGETLESFEISIIEIYTEEE